VKLNTSTFEAQGSGFEKVSDFRMAMNEKAARVLSDTLYTDKYGAIIRELSCNAFDAHLDAGKADIPFRIDLPDAFNPQLVIRDYGKGISPEDIKNVYCVYFGSTKDQSNDAVGAFGLGSKTPFAYTDSFTVTSIHKGVKRIYNAYRDKGMPTISQFGDGEETDEPDGLEVTVTVSKGDFESFKDAVYKQLRFFPVKPEVNTDIVWPEIESSIIKTGPFVYFKTNSRRLSGFSIQQGPVAYPVDFEVLRDYYKNTLKTDVPKLINFLDQGLRSNTYSSTHKGAVLNMPIGTVEVVPSREGISYSPETLHNIVTALTKVSDALFDTIKQRLHDEYNVGYSNFIDYYNSLEKFMQESASLDYIEKNFKPFTIVKGNLRILMPEKFVGININFYSHTISGRYWNKRISGYKKSSVTYTENWDQVGSYYGTPPATYAESNMRYSALDFALKEYPAYIKDDKYAFLQRAKEHCDLDNVTFVIIDGDVSEKLLKEFGDFISDFVDTTYISDTDRPTTNRSGTSTTGGRKRAWFEIRKHDYRSHANYGLFDNTLYANRFKEEYDTTVKDYDGDTLVYMTTVNNTLQHPVNSELKDVFHIVCNYIFDIADVKLVAIPKGSVAQAEKSNHFMSLEDFYKQHKNAIISRIEAELHSQFAASYMDKLQHLIQSVERMITYTTNYDGWDKVVFPSAGDDYASRVLYNIAPNGLKRATDAMDRSDLMDMYDDIVRVVHDGTSLEAVEVGMEKNDVTFTRFSETMKQVEAVLLDPKNAKQVLTDMLNGNITCVKLYDPCDNTTSLFDCKAIIQKVIDETC